MTGLFLCLDLTLILDYFKNQFLASSVKIVTFDKCFKIDHLSLFLRRIIRHIEKPNASVLLVIEIHKKQA